jgi:hypothetical protein
MTDDPSFVTIAYLPEPAGVTDELVEIDLPPELAEKVIAGEPVADYARDDQIRRIPLSLARARIRARIDQIDRRMVDLDVLGLSEWDDLDL